MNFFLAFMLTFACLLTNANYKSDLQKNMQAAFLFDKAERAYRDIVSYDENAPVTREEIYLLYARDAFFAPIREIITSMINQIDSLKSLSPTEYAEKCIYSGEIFGHPPEGVVFVNCYLYPFMPEEIKVYDSIQKSGEKDVLCTLFSPLEDYVLSCKGVFTPENGFEPYFTMKDKSAVIPVCRGARYLTDAAASAALSLSEIDPVSPPVWDARGVIVFTFISD